MARCWEMSTLSAGYIRQRKVTSVSSNGSLGFIVHVKFCRMVDSVPRWWLSLPWPIPCQSQIGWYRLWGGNIVMAKTQHIPGKQVLVRSWLWIFLTYTGNLYFEVAIRYSSTPKGFQTSYEGDIWCIFTVTFWEKVYFQNSSPVYFSPLYGSKLPQNIWGINLCLEGLNLLNQTCQKYQF